MEHEFVCEVPAHFTPDTPEYLGHLAVLLGNGKMSNRCTARVPQVMNCLRANPNFEVSELLAIGCTPKQAALIYAAVNVGRLLNSRPYQVGESIKNARDLYLRYRGRFFNCPREHFISLSLNSQNCIVQERIVSIGSLNTNIVHPREVFAPLVRERASAFCVMHNHPSGNPAPSQEDRDCTTRLARGGGILGIKLIDHVIIGHDDYFSFADAGQLGTETI